jgi:hypothetical protein
MAQELQLYAERWAVRRTIGRHDQALPAPNDSALADRNQPKESAARDACAFNAGSPGRAEAIRQRSTLAKVELRHLRYFVTVASEKHFGRAARRRFVSQPALSQQMRHKQVCLAVRLRQLPAVLVQPMPASGHVCRDARLRVAGGNDLRADQRQVMAFESDRGLACRQDVPAPVRNGSVRQQDERSLFRSVRLDAASGRQCQSDAPRDALLHNSSRHGTPSAGSAD